MTSWTANRLPYPNPSDPISAGADAIKALAQALQLVVVSVTVPAGAANPATASVTFPAGLFTSPPLVISSTSSSNAVTGLTAVSVTGATFQVTVRGTSGALPATMPGAVIVRAIAAYIVPGALAKADDEAAEDEAPEVTK